MCLGPHNDQSLCGPSWSLSGPEISGPHKDQIVWSLSGPGRCLVLLHRVPSAETCKGNCSNWCHFCDLRILHISQPCAEASTLPEHFFFLVKMWLDGSDPASSPSQPSVVSIGRLATQNSFFSKPNPTAPCNSVFVAQIWLQECFSTNPKRFFCHKINGMRSPHLDPTSLETNQILQRASERAVEAHDEPHPVEGRVRRCQLHLNRCFSRPPSPTPLSPDALHLTQYPAHALTQCQSKCFCTTNPTLQSGQ